MACFDSTTAGSSGGFFVALRRESRILANIAIDPSLGRKAGVADTISN